MSMKGKKRLTTVVKKGLRRSQLEATSRDTTNRLGTKVVPNKKKKPSKFDPRTIEDQ